MITASAQCLPQTKRLALPSAFLLKTFEILENEDYSNVISWNKDGDAFSVKNPNAFSDSVLPKFFKHSNYQSFVRQLNMYDFHKYRKNDESFFKHPYFKRGHKHLLYKIKRKTNVNFISSQTLQEYTTPQINTEMNDLVFNIKSKQGELENTLSYLISQNYHLLDENRRLWNELLKQMNNKEDNKEKMLYLMCQNLTQRSYPTPKGLALGDTKHEYNQFIPNQKCHISGEQDGLLHKLFQSFCNKIPQNSHDFMLNECSKKIKKKKFNLQKLRERMDRKLKNSEDLQMSDFNSFSPLHFENGWTDQIGNEELKSNKTDQTDPEETVYNMASPSAFLNIESSNFNEEGHKNSNTNLMGTNKEKIYDLENETEVLFEEIKE